MIHATGWLANIKVNGREEKKNRRRQEKKKEKEKMRKGVGWRRVIKVNGLLTRILNEALHGFGDSIFSSVTTDV